MWQPPAFAPPPPLQPGDRIVVIAPASPFDPETFARGLARLRDHYEVCVREDIHQRAGYLAGEDTRRWDEFAQALEDPGVQAIVAARGGYGAMRLLERMTSARLDQVRTPRKLLVGMSDITALHAIWARSGVRSLHAPMVAALGRHEQAWSGWVEAVEGSAPPPSFRIKPWSEGRAEGPVLGGNLSLVAALAGTPWALPCHGCILFLEDVGEAPYRIDRMLTTLRLQGALGRVAGVVLGQFTHCNPRPDGVEVEHVLRERLRALGVPVGYGLPVGHEADNRPLPLGARAVLDCWHGTLRFEEGAVETQRS